MRIRHRGFGRPRHRVGAAALSGAAVMVAASVAAQQGPRQLTLEASDGVVVHGDWYEAGSREAPVVLLFHQGGSNARAEYASIAPRLVEAGYSVLAIDQRRGGSNLGGENRTASALAGREYHYCDAAPDLAAALAHVRSLRPGVRPVLWGSSYSSTLALRLAAERGSDVAAVLAFSPAAGDPMGACQPDEAAAEVEVPALVLRPESEMEIPRVAAQLEHYAELGLETYVARSGVHGSSMLNPERVDGDVEPTWEVVMEFLRRVAPTG